MGYMKTVTCEVCKKPFETDCNTDTCLACLLKPTNISYKTKPKPRPVKETPANDNP